MPYHTWVCGRCRRQFDTERAAAVCEADHVSPTGIEDVCWWTDVLAIGPVERHPFPTQVTLAFDGHPAFDYRVLEAQLFEWERKQALKMGRR